MTDVNSPIIEYNLKKLGCQMLHVLGDRKKMQTQTRHASWQGVLWG